MASLACAFLAACAGPAPRRSRAPEPPGGGAAAPATPPDVRPLIMFIGTSLTAGLGVDRDSAYPAVIQRIIDSLGLRARVQNAGVSGETSAGALRRMDWLMRDAPDIVVLETGANDGLRGLDADSTRANIDSIIAFTRHARPTAAIVLVGMQAPPNMGARFTSRFRGMYGDIARADHLPLVPFLLAGVAGIDSLNQADGIHPTSTGHRIVARTVWAVLEPLIVRRTS